MEDGTWTHVGLGVTEINRSKRFWEDIFRFKEETNYTIEGTTIGQLMQLPGSVKFNNSMIAQDNLSLDILQPVRPKPLLLGERSFTEQGLNYVSMRVPVAQVPAVRQQIGEHGGKVLPGNGYARDPDGQLIQLLQGGTAISFDHVGLNVTDIGKSRRFFQEVLGFRPVGEGELDGKSEAEALRLRAAARAHTVTLSKGTGRLELLAFESPRPARQGRAFNEPGLIHIGLREVPLELLGELRRDAEAHGGKVLRDTIIADTKEERWKRTVGTSYIADPDGQRIVLFPKQG